MSMENRRRFMDIYELLGPGVKIVALSDPESVHEFERIETKGGDLGAVVCRDGSSFGAGGVFDFDDEQGIKRGYKIVSE